MFQSITSLFVKKSKGIITKIDMFVPFPSLNYEMRQNKPSASEDKCFSLFVSSHCLGHVFMKQHLYEVSNYCDQSSCWHFIYPGVLI